ncbi:MAG: CdaR family protein [Dissulfurimicrobium sp.]|uniref:CdaR family protein n=1 Tax=Dissulfurimicrobium sp. TaxID=2022436 RepID=UPI003D10C452
MGEEKAEITVSLPVEVINLPKDLIIANDIPTAINVRIFGPRSLIRDVAIQRLPKIIDLKNTSPGKITIHIDPETLPIPTGVKITRFQPSEFNIILEPMMRKELMVKPEIIGTPAKGYKIEKIETIPDRVIASGLPRELNKLREIKTLPINIDGATEIIKVRSGLNMKDITNTETNISEVTVTVYIKPIEGIKKIQRVPVKLYPPISKISFWPKEVSITLKGPLTELNNITANDITVMIETQDLTKGIHVIEPKCIVPEGISLLNIIPQKIKVYKAKK